MRRGRLRPVPSPVPGPVPGPVLALVLGLLAAAVAVVVVLDQRVLDDEVRAVDACVAEARRSDDAVAARLAATASYAAPAPLPPGQDGSLADVLLARSAREVTPRVEEVRDGCRAVQVRAWHVATSSRRDAVADYLTARLAQLRCVVEQRGCYADDGGTALVRLRERAFGTAVPTR